MPTHRILFRSITLTVAALALVPFLAGCAAPRTEAEYQQRAALANAWSGYFAQRQAIAAQRAAELNQQPQRIVICRYSYSC